MARAGIYKSEVLRARDSLLSQGKNPSIDAIRAELGNTGSKTTIHRYLKELEEEEGVSKGSNVAVSEALQELVGRLAARLHEEADERMAEMATVHAQQMADCRDEITRLGMEAVANQAQLQQVRQQLETEQQALKLAEQALQVAAVRNADNEQQIAGMQARLLEHQSHCASLEEKHRYARDALEHFRQSMKDLRDQEQRRHEQQVQQLQAEIRLQSQTLVIKQDELTRLYQDVARHGAELLAANRELHDVRLERARLQEGREQMQCKLQEQEARLAAMDERLAQVQASREEVWQLLQLAAMQQQGRESDAENEEVAESAPGVADDGLEAGRSEGGD